MRVGRGEQGQGAVLFVLMLVVLLGFVALAIDVGMAFQERSNAQNATDAAALAGAQQLAAGGDKEAATTEAKKYLADHGYEGPQDTITVNIPPLSGPYTGDSGAVEVLVSTQQAPIFRAPLVDGLWSIGARAVASVFSTQSQPLTFASLRDDCKNHTLLIQAGGTLTVGGGIYVNSCNGADGSGKGSVPPGYGDAFDIFGAGGKIVADSIHVVGGWETHDGCTVSPVPLIRQPKLEDPLKDLAAPNPSTLPVRYGTATSPSTLKITGGTVTLQPGIYYGGIRINGDAKVTMADGIYYIAGSSKGGGFEVSGNATLTAPHVMIYNSRSSGKKGDYNELTLSSSSTITMGPMTGGDYQGMLIFQDRLNDEDIYVNPGNGIDGLSGTIYAPADEATVVIKASGTANMQIIAGMINVQGADATFQYQAGGLAGAQFRLAE